MGWGGRHKPQLERYRMTQYLKHNKVFPEGSARLVGEWLQNVATPMDRKNFKDFTKMLEGVREHARDGLEEADG